MKIGTTDFIKNSWYDKIRNWSIKVNRKVDGNLQVKIKKSMVTGLVQIQGNCQILPIEQLKSNENR